jgi:hypothetical protein
VRTKTRLSDSDIHNLAADSMLPNIHNHPVPVGAEDVEKILQKLSGCKETANP